MRRASWVNTIVCIMLVLAMMLAGCGDKEDTASRAQEETVQAETTVTEDVKPEASDTEALDKPSEEDTTDATDEGTVTEVIKIEPEVVEVPTEATSPTHTMDAVSTDSLVIPDYSGNPYVAINDNVPFFTDSDMTTDSYEFYSELDELGRCGVTYACVGQDIMPTEERGSIGQVKPTGWHTVKYDCVDGKYLYNRCHLLGYQLTGENANTRNLITGTRYLNVTGMLPFENMVADYVKETNNHVMYRVTPIFEGTNLVADGVLMEAKSVEDNGDGVLYNVFCYNVQPGVVIDYATGESALGETPVAQEPTTTTDSVAEPAPAAPVVEQPSQTETPTGTSYVLNSNTMKFHYPSCGSAAKIKPENRIDFVGTRDEVIAQGYVPCKKCNP